MKYRTKVATAEAESIRVVLDDLVELVERIPPDDRKRVVWEYLFGKDEATKEDNENQVS